jgi:hypothetical protein
MRASTVLIMLVAGVARLLLVLNLPIRLLPSDLASAVWLGESNQLPPPGAPGYRLFLAVTNLSSLPLSAAHALFQAAAISVAAWAVFRLTRSASGATATLLGLTFCPVGLALHRVSPDQVYWAQVLLDFSLFAIVLLAPPRARYVAMAVAGVTGAMFGWTWFTGESELWFLPAFVLLIVGKVATTRYSRDGLRTLARNLGVTTAGFVAVNAAVLFGGLHSGLLLRVLPPSPTSQWASLPRSLVTAAEAVLHPDLAATTPVCAVSVDSAEFERYWTFLNRPEVKVVRPDREVAMLGWYYNSQSTEWPVFKAYNQDGQEIPFVLTRQDSADLQHHFSDDRASLNRFRLVFRSPDACAITAQTTGGPELRVVIDPKQGLYAGAGSAQLNIDAVSDSAASALNPGAKLAAVVGFSLNGLYEGVIPFLLPVGFMAAFAASWRAFSARAIPPMLLTALAAWILVASRIVLLAIINASAVTVHYSAPASYLGILAACLSLTVLSVGPRPAAAMNRT